MIVIVRSKSQLSRRRADVASVNLTRARSWFQKSRGCGRQALQATHRGLEPEPQKGCRQFLGRVMSCSRRGGGIRMLPSRVVGRRRSLLWRSGRHGRRRVPLDGRSPPVTSRHRRLPGRGWLSRPPCPGDASWCGCTAWHGISPSLVSTMAGRGRGSLFHWGGGRRREAGAAGAPRNISS